jgi:hypothetical protein
MFTTIEGPRRQLAIGLVLLGVAGGLVAATGSDRGVNAGPGRGDSFQREAMIRALGSEDPNPSLGEEAQTFDRLVGAWDAYFTFYRDDGTVSHQRGELFFGWIMDGRAVQDLWILYPSGDRKERTIGTTIRFFDTALKQWRVVFVNPQFDYMVTMQGGREGDRIVLRGVDPDGLPMRWTFSELTPTSFHWQGEKSHDGGKSWKLEEDHRMTRRPA